MAAPRGLHALARLHGIQTAYHDNGGCRVAASPESLAATLRALRVPIRDPGDAPRLLRHGRRQRWERAVEPVIVAWDDAVATCDVRLGGDVGGSIDVHVEMEGGGERSWEMDAASLDVTGAASLDGVSFTRVAVPLPALSYGYHRLALEVRRPGRPSERHEALLISAPRRSAGWEVLGGGGRWGVFAPLYALHEGEAAPPTFSLLDRLAAEVSRLGGAVVGTLPLLAAFLDRPYEPSPYAPVSRLFWNEVFVDVEGLPIAGGDTPVASESGPGAESGVGAWPGGDRRPPPFDAGAVMASKRPAIEAWAREMFAGRDDWPPELLSFRARRPRVDDYARFRALTEALGPWRQWPDRLRARDVRPGEYAEEAFRYHVCAQWLAERQLTEARERAEARGVSLYLDLPLGVHRDGYDVWRERALFATEAAAGAPPDPLAVGGQDWGFPPIHPEASRMQGHGYFIASIREQLRFARVLRIDHVMQLHRMFWVPEGVPAERGVYVRYPAQELLAILCLESHRAGAVIVGEDLGTVPRTVRRSMRRHALPGMWVGEFELTDTEGGAALRPRGVPAGALASVDTHDTPTFAGWWWGRDAELRQERGHLSEAEAAAEVAGRAELRRKLSAGLGVQTEAAVDGGGRDGRTARRVHRALLEWMGRSRAGLVLATLEDLWLETEPQNVPGSTGPWNWRRRSRRPLDALRDPAVAAQLRALNEAREGKE